ncbi:MAG: mismatch repair protein MutS domain protein [Clostridia bacterium]|nr:mismatch repair protein MutS domain protein [Clostridia bacterium]
MKNINDTTEKNLAACSEMQINANYGRMVLNSLKSIYNILKAHSVKSSALMNIRQFCHSIIDNPSVLELQNIFNEIATVDIEDTTFQIIAKFNDNLHISDVYINRIKYLLPKISEEAEPRKINFFKKQRVENTDDRITVPMSFKTIETSDLLIREAVRELSYVIEKISENIYLNLYKVSKELEFYKFALRYINFLKENNINFCYSEIMNEDENTLEYNSLSDLFLICSELSSYGICQVVSNDVFLSPDIKGALIKGKNNSGKTVFLRSIGIAQVFAQSGLPITAISAKISIRNGIFTQFSSAEEKFIAGDISGRFEAEVKEIDTIIKNLKSNSLILFNETFQTTSFDEAAEGMKDILEFITELKGKWLFVTHILKLFSMYGEDMQNVIFMQTSEDPNRKHKMEIITEKIYEIK